MLFAPLQPKPKQKPNLFGKLKDKMSPAARRQINTAAEDGEELEDLDPQTQGAKASSNGDGGVPNDMSAFMEQISFMSQQLADSRMKSQDLQRQADELRRQLETEQLRNQELLEQIADQSSPSSAASPAEQAELLEQTPQGASQSEIEGLREQLRQALGG